MPIPAHPLFRTAFSVASLGAGAYDGEPAIVRYGGERARLRWCEPAARWLGEAHRGLSFCDLAMMGDANVGPNDWAYVQGAVTTSKRPWGWTPGVVFAANLAYQAGLALQEKVDYVAWGFNNVDGEYDMAPVWYSLNDGDSISPLIEPSETEPGRTVGTIIRLDKGLRRPRSTGWVDCPISAPTNSTLLPHLYTAYRSGGQQGVRIEYVQVEWRWMGAVA